MGDHDASGSLRFDVLGPLRVWRDGAELDAGPVQQRVVLAVLLLHANRPLPRDRLVEAVWGTAAPGRAVNLLQRHAAGLRRVLEPGRPARAPSRLLTWTEAGYVLSVPAGRLDLEAFTGQVARGRAARAAGDLPGAADALHGALDLWRGRLCEGLTGPLLEAERDRLEEDRLGLLEERVEADLALGRHSAVVAELTGLVHRYPLRERLRAQLMLALYRSGRQAEALAAYREARTLLVEELGIEPGPELRSLEQAVLAADPALAPPAPPSPGPAPAPCLLPGDVAGFIGREEQLDRLDRLTAPDAASTAAVVCLVSGTPGVGKTALAVHWAHRVRPGFPDGQLYVNLRGYDPEQPMSAGEALAGLLSALGLRGQDIPLDVEGRSARYRSELAARRALVVLDNAATAEQVRPLLPGTPTCPAVVTSRDALPGLVALHGAHRLELDLLSAGEARVLLHQLIGPRVQAEPEATAALAELCRRLPLALRLAAELAAARPHHRLADIAAELADRQRRLDLLETEEDAAAGVRAVFSWSYQRLPAQAARAFRLLALHPGPDWDSHAAGACTGTSAAGPSLDRLVRAHLVEPTGPDRYTMHDLLRAYAAELAATTDPEPERRSALTRLFDHYLATATTATTTLGHHALEMPEPHRPAPAAPAPLFDAPDAARAWLDAERANLVAVCAHAAGHGWHGHAMGLAAALFRYLDMGGHYAEALAVHTDALHAARDHGDHGGEAYALTHLGFTYWQQGHFPRALDHHRQALDLFRRTGDRSGEAYALTCLGLVFWRQGEYRRAVEHHHRSLDLFRDLDDRAGQARALTHLGLVHWRQGECQKAMDHHRRAVELLEPLDDPDGQPIPLTCLGLVLWRLGEYRRAVEYHHRALDISGALGDRAGQAYALTHLGLVLRRQGEYQQAVEHHRRSLDLFERLGNRAGQSYALTHLGLVCCRLGEYRQAVEHHHRALDLALQSGSRAAEIEALNGLGEALQAGGRTEEAGKRHAEALAAAEEIEERFEQARAHAGIATAHDAAGDPDRARRHREAARSLYADLGVPEAETMVNLCSSKAGGFETDRFRSMNPG